MKPLREQLLEEYEKVSHLHTSTYTAREDAGFASFSRRDQNKPAAAFTAPSIGASRSLDSKSARGRTAPPRAGRGSKTRDRRSPQQDTAQIPIAYPLVVQKQGHSGKPHASTASHHLRRVWRGKRGPLLHLSA